MHSTRYEQNGITIEKENKKLFWSRGQILQNSEIISEIIYNLDNIIDSNKCVIKKSIEDFVQDGIIITKDSIEIYDSGYKMISWKKSTYKNDYILIKQIIKLCEGYFKDKKKTIKKIWDSLDRWEQEKVRRRNKI